MAHLMPRNTAIKLIDKYGTNCPFEIAERKGIMIIFESLGGIFGILHVLQKDSIYPY